ncbi:ATP-grasp domain-containing protein [Gemmata sp.]|uniref:ATP-grasp domain-containing protein n=1 Tax=Gemmata sp. TaxID=1914242 RepID=UPI003F717FB9
MRVFVYESLTATGAGRDPASPGHGMFREGRAMRDAVVADLGRVPGVEVWFLPDAAPTEPRQFADAVGASDWSLVIAPECGGELLRLARRVVEHGGRLLGPSLSAIQLCSDKLALAAHWRDRGVRTPATTDREPTRCEPFPVVWKPRDGAGSTSTFRLDSHFALASAKAKLAAEAYAGPMILQEFVPGRAASVAFLCGPAGTVQLLPAFQLLSADDRFRYLGGEVPVPADLAERATRLAQRAVSCVPGLLGYVGVDLVLGDAADGSRDFAIEINPRLTTSYVGLRELADFNLGEALLAAAAGEVRGPLRWKPGRVRFGPDGSVATA